MPYSAQPSILILSSTTEGSGVLGTDILDALRDEGCDVDLMTIHDDRDDVISVFSREELKISFLGRVRRFTRKKLGLQLDPSRIVSGYCIYYLDEEKPPVNVGIVLDKIKKKYDFVVVLFWHRFLSFSTIRSVDEKLGHVPWAFVAVDFSTLGGGCHFPHDCENWKTGCGNCPAFRSHDANDRTHRNFLYRKSVLQHLNVTLCCNTFMRDNFYSKSPLYAGKPIEISYNLIDEDVFTPKDMIATRRSLNLPDDKFILLFGSQQLYDPKKGMEYLFKALKIFYDSLAENERERVLILSVGRTEDDISQYIPFDYENRGYVAIDVLSNLYSVSNVFVCSSVFDPGPMMLNQALSCGTPVVAFDSGGMLDVKQFADVGYVAKLKDAGDLAEGIKHVFTMNRNEYEALRSTCRETALKMTSRHAIASRLLSIYSKMVTN
jgi:glycosyltransferase involved in cell wall biosynthesis